VVVPEPGLIGSVELLDALLAVLDSLDVKASVIDEMSVREGGGGFIAREEAWPVLLTPRDTAGEKEVEVFVGSQESARAWLPGLDLVESEFSVEEATIAAGWVGRQFENPVPGASLKEIEERLARSIPNLRHVAGSSRLDDRV
jgi:hypothetical protein